MANEDPTEKGHKKFKRGIDESASTPVEFPVEPESLPPIPAESAPADAAPEPELPRVPVEEIATKRGHLPMWIAGAPIRVNQLGVVREIQSPPSLNLAHWKFAAARALRNWPVAAEITEKQYDEAVHEAINTRIG